MSNKEGTQEESNCSHIGVEKKENVEKQKKNYIKIFCCKMSTGIIAAYICIILSIAINLVNRVLFLNYEFTFDYTLIFLQEIACLVFYMVLSWKSKIFKEKVGELSFKDFWKLKYKYIGYSLFFLIKTLTSFTAYQIVTNIPMYVSLRKLVTPMIFIYQFFFKKKKIDKIKIIVVFFITTGAILSGIDDYSTDYIGYLVVFSTITLSVIDYQILENFKTNNGVSNIKLLVYNSVILPPLLLIIIVFKEFRDLINYFKAFNFSYIGFLLNLFLSCSIICFLAMFHFISIEKNKSLLTRMLNDSKSTLSSLLSYFILKTFEFTWKNVLGLIISTSGAIIITISSMLENIRFKKDEKNKLSGEQKIEMINIGNINENNDENKQDENNEKKIDNNNETVMDIKNEKDIEEKAKSENDSFSNDSSTNTCRDIDINSTDLSINDISNNDENKEDIKKV